MEKEFDSIIGYSSEKAELKQIADTLKNTERYAALGVSTPKGLLLHGEPGVGKTLMATSLIKASGRPVFTCRKNQPNGDFVLTIKDTFAEAVKNAPSIVFLDDMDKFTNGDENHRDAEEYVTVQSCIDEIKGSEVFVLATANSLRSLPRSLLRAGRFDRIIEIDAPSGRDAERIIKHYLSGKKYVSGLDAGFIARVLEGHSCAELETVINEAGLYAGFARKDCITMEHFLNACMRTVFEVPSAVICDDAEQIDLPLYEAGSTKAQIACHEAGHAVISEILFPGSVTLVSAYSRKEKSGGFTLCHRSGNEPLLEWLQSRIIVSLGGMAALEQRFGVADIGTEKDLDSAFDYAQDLVVNNCISGVGLHAGSYGDSQEQRYRQEQVVASEIERYYREAKRILSQNSQYFEKIESALKRKGLLTMFDIRKIASECRRTA